MHTLAAVACLDANLLPLVKASMIVYKVRELLTSIALVQGLHDCIQGGSIHEVCWAWSRSQF